MSTISTEVRIRITFANGLGISTSAFLDWTVQDVALLVARVTDKMDAFPSLALNGVVLDRSLTLAQLGTLDGDGFEYVGGVR